MQGINFKKSGLRPRCLRQIEIIKEINNDEKREVTSNGIGNIFFFLAINKNQTDFSSKFDTSLHQVSDI